MVAESGPDGSTETIDLLFAAVVEATEEAIINALFRATTVIGRDDHVREALPLGWVAGILRQAGRLPVRMD
jgi:D-aminopeptidase